MSNLPYDAQIEYLEGTGTQYINTGFTNTKSTEFVMDFQLTDATGDRKAIGQGFKFGLGQYSNKWRIIDSQWYNTSIATDTLRHIAYTDNGKYYIDSTQIADRYSQKTAGTYPMLLFAVSSQNSVAPDGNPAKMKLYSCKIYDDGVLVRDFIPVRVGQVGYLYDKVTEELFGNAGTGSFTLGNDVVWSYGRNVVKGFRRRLLFENYSRLPNYLCFTALEDGTFSYIFVKNQNTDAFQHISYSTDGINWTQTTNVNNQEITATTPIVEAGTKVYWKGVGVANSLFNNSSYAGHFSSTGRFNVSGNICSVLFNDNFENIVLNRRAMFLYMFSGCNKLVEAGELVLPTPLYETCFSGLFINCSSLVKGPQLPAITLAAGCYSGMFYNCSSLINAPALPATTLVNECYSSMFYHCASLINTPQMTINSVANRCCSDMFNGCSSLENINITFNAMTLADYCYSGMFDSCSSVTTAPNLPATTLANYCYSGMYKSCTKLVNVQDELPATTLVTGCYDSIFNGCSSLTKFVKILATNTANSCCKYMFYFTAATGKIELPATVLSQSCYEQMLRCNPTYIVMLGIDTSPSNCLTNWVYNIPNTPDRIFVKHIDATWTTTGNSGVPTNWTVIYYDPALDKYYTDQTRAIECDDHGNPI